MSATRPADPPRRRLALPGWAVTAGLSLALTAGCLDVAWSLWKEAPGGLRSGVHVVWAVGVTVGMVLVVCLIGAVVVRLGRRPHPLSPSPISLPPPAGRGGTQAEPFRELATQASTTSPLSRGWVGGRWERGTGGEVLLAAPLLSAELLLALWLGRYRLSPAAAAVGLAVVAVLTIVLLVRLRPPLSPRPWLAGAAVLALAGPWLAAWASEDGSVLRASRRRHAVPRVVVLSIDTLRADAVSAAHTPSLHGLAGGSVVFRRAYSPAPWTLPSMASVMTGVAPQVHQALHSRSRVPDELVTLAEVLRRSGYRTAALVSSTVLGPAVRLDQGFEEYRHFPGPWLGRSFGAGLLRRHVDRFRPDEAPPPDLAEHAAGWLQAHRDEDFFLWVHVFDPHAPYGPPRLYLAGRQPPAGGWWRFEGWDEEAIRDGTWVPTPAEREWIRQLYLGEVRYADDFAGRLVAELKRLGLYEDTLLVILSDHGEEFWEHDAYGHGHTLYDELLHVPLLLKLPRSVRTGAVDLPVSTASVMPTVLGLCGLPLPSGYPAEPSLLPHLQGNSPAPAPLVSLGLNRFEDRQAVRFGRFKYIRWEMTGREELYDLQRDPGERIDLAPFAQGEIATGRRLLAGFAAQGRRARQVLRLRDGEEADLDSYTLERLRSLGYAR